MNKIRYRDYSRLIYTAIFSWLYIPHLIAALIVDKTNRGGGNTW